MDPILRDPRAWGVMLAAMLTIMSNATITPALPGLQAMYPGNPDAEMLTRMLITAPSLIVAIVAPFAGALVDRMGRRRPLFFGLAVYAVAGTAGLYLSSLEAILGSRLLLGLGVASIMTAQAALIGDYFTGPERGRLMGYQIAAVNMGGLVFVMTAGLLARRDPTLPFLIYGLSVPLIPLLWRLLPEPPRIDAGPGHAHTDTGEPGWPATVGIMAAAAAMTFVIFYSIPTQIPYHLARLGMEDPQYAGEVMASMMFAAASMAVVSGWIRPWLGRIGTPVTGYALLASGFAALAAGHSLTAAMLATALIGAGLGLCIPTFVITALNASPASHRGLVSGVVTSSFFFGQFLSPLASQPLVGRWGYPATFATASAACILLALILALTIRRRPAPMDRPGPAH